MSKPILAALVLTVGLGVATSQLALRYGMRQLGQQHSALSWRMLQAAVANPWVLASLALSGLAYIAYAFLLSRVEISLAAPATNTVFYLAMFVVAALWFGEHVTLGRTAAVFMLVVAMWLLSRSAA